MKTIKVKDRFRDIEHIVIDGQGYSSIITLPKSLARNLELNRGLIEKNEQLTREIEEVRVEAWGERIRK